jgi:uncharacterized protein (DUF1330 family)
MPAYVVANIDVTNPEGYREYTRQVDATIEAHGGRFLARGGELDVREGDWRPRLVLLEFPSLDAARAWYDSPGYQRLRGIRAANSTGDLALVDGLSA